MIFFSFNSDDNFTQQDGEIIQLRDKNWVSRYLQSNTERQRQVENPEIYPTLAPPRPIIRSHQPLDITVSQQEQLPGSPLGLRGFTAWRLGTHYWILDTGEEPPGTVQDLLQDVAGN